MFNKHEGVESAPIKQVLGFVARLLLPLLLDLDLEPDELLWGVDLLRNALIALAVRGSVPLPSEREQPSEQPAEVDAQQTPPRKEAMASRREPPDDDGDTRSP